MVVLGMVLRDMKKIKYTIQLVFLSAFFVAAMGTYSRICSHYCALNTNKNPGTLFGIFYYFHAPY